MTGVASVPSGRTTVPQRRALSRAERLSKTVAGVVGRRPELIAAVYARKSTDQNLPDAEKSVARQIVAVGHVGPVLG